MILRPVFFMENLPSPWFLNGDKLGTAMKPTTKLQMIAVDDIGRIGARAFTDAAKLKGREIELAGDAVTMTEAAAGLSKALGKKIEFVQYPIEAVRANSNDFALMSSGLNPRATTPISRRWTRSSARPPSSPTGLAAWASSKAPWKQAGPGHRLGAWFVGGHYAHHLQPHRCR